MYSWYSTKCMVPVPNRLNDVPQIIYLIMLAACGEIKLFVYDTKIYSTIKDTSDIFLLQKNLDMVNEWSHQWLLKFNADKCKLLQLGNSSPAN